MEPGPPSHRAHGRPSDRRGAAPGRAPSRRPRGVELHARAREPAEPRARHVPPGGGRRPGRAERALLSGTTASTRGRHHRIRESRPGWNLWRDGCPGGEAVADVSARVDPLVSELKASEGDVLLFAHGHGCACSPRAGWRWRRRPVLAYGSPRRRSRCSGSSARPPCSGAGTPRVLLARDRCVGRPSLQRRGSCKPRRVAPEWTVGPQESREELRRAGWGERPSAGSRACDRGVRRAGGLVARRLAQGARARERGHTRAWSAVVAPATTSIAPIARRSCAR